MIDAFLRLLSETTYTRKYTGKSIVSVHRGRNYQKTPMKRCMVVDLQADFVGLDLTTFCGLRADV